MRFSSCLKEANSQNSQISAAAIYFVVWLREFGANAGQDAQEKYMSCLFKKEETKRSKLFFDLLAAGLICLNEAAARHTESEVAIWRYLALSKMPSLLAKVHKTEGVSNEDSSIVTSMKMISSFPRLKNAGEVFQNCTPFEILDSKFQSLCLIKRETFSFSNKLFALSVGNVNIPEIKGFLESFTSRPEISHFQILVYIIENNLVYQEQATLACLDYLKLLVASKRYGDLCMVLASLLDNAKRLKVMFLYIPLSTFLCLIEGFWQEDWLKEGHGESYQLFGISVALALQILETFKLHKIFGGLLKNPHLFPIYVSCLGGTIDFEQEIVQGALLGSKEFNETLANSGSPQEAVVFFRTCLLKTISSNNISEWLRNTAHEVFLGLIASKFSFLIFEGINIILLATSDRWELKLPFICFIKAFFSHPTLPQQFFETYGRTFFELLESSDWPDIGELPGIIKQRCGLKEKLGLLKKSDVSKYIADFLFGFQIGSQPNVSGLGFLDAFQVFSSRLGALGSHAFSVTIVEELLAQGPSFSDAVEFASLVLCLPLQSQDLMSMSLQELWAEVLPDQLRRLDINNYNHSFLLGHLAAISLLMASSNQGFLQLLAVSQNMIHSIFTPDVEDTYLALHSLVSSDLVDSPCFLETQSIYQESPFNTSHLGFISGLLHDSNILKLFQT